MEQTNSAGAAHPQQSVKGLSIRGLGQVITQPAKFFEQLKDNPRILVPLLAVFFGVFVVTFLVADIQQQDQIELMRNSKFAQGQDLSAETTVGKKLLGAAIGGIVVSLIVTPIVAVIALIVGNFMMGGLARFKQVWSVTLYASVIATIGMLVKVPLILMKGTTQVSLSFAALMPTLEATSPVYLILEAFNFFTIWEIIVAGIGFATIYQFTRNKGYIISVISNGVVLLGLTGMQILIFSFIM